MTAIVTTALSILGGPLAAVGGAIAGGAASRAVQSALRDDGDDKEDHQRLDLGAISQDELHRFIRSLARQLGVAEVLAPADVRVKSYQIAASRAESEEPDTSFLNSFIVDDLAAVATAVRAGRTSRPLKQYLSIAENTRIDVRLAPDAVLAGLTPSSTPRGRWVTDPGLPLVFSQQFAVNEALAAGPGLFAVNGPPGTGKTTMLRDLIAAIVVDRAIELARLSRPADVFTGRYYDWSTPSVTHQIWVPAPQVTGAEIVVASSNNGAVENVTTEIPGAKAVGEDFQREAESLDYFRETAATVHGEGAWAMIAARLGNRKNRAEFVDRFWWKSMRGALGQTVPPDWHTAVQTFTAALNKVNFLADERMRAANALARLPAAQADRAVAALDAESASWPRVGLARRKLERRNAEIQALSDELTAARRRWGRHIPEFAITTDPDLTVQREKSAPWGDEELARARTELFLAALQLHKAVILRTADRFWKNLNAMCAILAGGGHPEPEARLAAWQTFFLVVPVVSSTFASFGRLFDDLGPESLGWLLIDEAGQATPQNAVGALWRSRRAVIVGDPLQLEPVVTLPWGGQQALLTGFGVTEEWAPSRTSVQQIADQHARYGTWLPSVSEGKPVWVGTPLRVHRRCDRPMFDISNTIAYDGLMVFGTPDRDSYPGTDGWIDVRSSDASGHWIPAEGDVLREVLTGLGSSGVAAADIRVLSPFRTVAENAREIYAEVFPSVMKSDRESWVGTVHTMQGKEADAVILILGGDPRKPGARGFATKTPNLLNVAVSRARRRLIVIGNRDTWGKEGCFTALADRLPVADLTAVITAEQSPGLADSVWRTRFGSTYHQAPDCDALEAGFRKARENGRQVSTPRSVPLPDAQHDGLMPCRNCYPPDPPPR